MKIAFRVIGCILSSVLSLILVLSLLSSLLLAGLVNAVTPSGMEDLVSSMMEDEEMQGEVASLLVEEAGLEFLGESAVASLMEKPSIQALAAEIASDAFQAALSQGAETGEIDFAGILREVDPATLEAASKDIAEVVLEDEDVKEELCSSIMDSGITGELSRDDVAEILELPAVKTAVGEIISDAIVGGISGEEIDVSAPLSRMLEEEPETFDPIIGNILDSMEMSQEDLYQNVCELAEEYGAALPSETSSPSALFAYALQLDGMNFSIRTDELGDIDYAPDDEEAVDDDWYGEEDGADDGYWDAYEIPTNEIAVGSYADEDAELLQMISVLLSTLQSPSFWIGIVILLLCFFLLEALFTWSFRIPFLFNGIVLALVGLQLLAISFVSADVLLISATGLSTIAERAIYAIWDTARGCFLAYGIGAVVLGVIFCVLFALLGKKGKKAKTAA